jgi:hypothetical protein
MQQERFITNRKAFTADTDDLDFVADQPAAELVVGFDFLQNGSTAPTLAQALGALSRIRVKLGGSPIIELSQEELFVLQYYFLDLIPYYVLPNGDNQQGIIGPIVVPLNQPARPKGQLQVQALYAGHTTIDTEKLTLIHRFGPQTRRELAGIAGYLSMLRTSKTPTQVGWSDSATISLPTRGLLHGFLAKLTTIPGGTTGVASSSIVTGKITVGGADWDIFNIVTANPEAELLSEASAPRAILDDYIFRRYSPPLDLGAAVTKFEWEAGTADAIVFVPLVEVPA